MYLPPPPVPPREPDVGRLGRILVRHWWILIAGVALSLVVGLVVTALQTPRYESAATIRLEEEERGPGLMAAFAPPGLAAAAGFGGGGSIQTDIGVLQSRVLAEAVVDSLDLNVIVRDSKTPRDSLLSVLSAPTGNQRGGEYLLRRDERGGYRVVPGKDATPPHPERVAPGEVFSLGGAELRLLPSITRSAPDEIRIVLLPFRTAVGHLRENLVVMRPDPGARLIQIRFRHPDAVIAAGVPNVLARSFVEYKTRENQEQSLSTVGFLEEQVGNYAASLRTAEQNLERFREEARVYDPEEQARAGVQQVASLQAQRDQVEAEHSALVRLLRRVEAAGPTNGRSPYRQLASFPTFFANGVVQDILRTLTQLESERSQLMVLRTAENADVEALDERIDALEQQLHRLASSYAQNLETNLATLSTDLARYQGQLETIPAREIDLHRLTREQRMLEQVYTLLQTRLKEEQIEATRVAGNVHVVDAALLPLSPSSPRPLLNLAVAGLVGVLLALGFVGMRELSAPKVHSGDDLLLAGIGAPVLGIIPRGAFSRPLRGVLPGTIQRRLQPPLNQTALVTRADPLGVGAEAYRSLRTGVLRGSNGSRPQIIAVISAMNGEGKSVSSANLAVSLAQQGRRTILIDADLRGGKLHRLFQTQSEPGLSDLLQGRAELDGVLREIALQDADSPLHLLAVGGNPLQASELVDSPHMTDLLQLLRESYEHIVIDTPPLNLVSDAAVLASAADTTLLVARTGVTDRRALQHASNLLRQLQVPLGGVVLTDVPGMGWYQGYGYGSTGRNDG